MHLEGASCDACLLCGHLLEHVSVVPPDVPVVPSVGEVMLVPGADIVFVVMQGSVPGVDMLFVVVQGSVTMVPAMQVVRIGAVWLAMMP